jgi:hypothetical protein
MQSTNKLTLAALAGLALLSSIHAAMPSQPIEISVADRIARAFAVSTSAEATPGIWVSSRTRTGTYSTSCSNEIWPDFEAHCRAKVDGSSRLPIRLAKIGYATGPGETVLLRKPASQIASR